MAGLCEGGNEPSGSLKAMMSSLSPTLLNIYLADLVKNCFQNMGGVVVRGRLINCIRFADDMTLLAEEEMILRDMLLELNDSCEQYGMKINANKTKAMVIGRKVKKITGRQHWLKWVECMEGKELCSVVHKGQHTRQQPQMHARAVSCPRARDASPRVQCSDDRCCRLFSHMNYAKS
ncbi:hypothetical protein ANN_18104 [Periplaneta americana]|uniref:Reverse transcriptase domain-containing protein n=1 Tax=Periplaneta americana TaxID=6978 RepID=A0ABQ8SNB5_PERAM|nr:hypothetical protein ANN_18104 [Periplaneta americana]